MTPSTTIETGIATIEPIPITPDGAGMAVTSEVKTGRNRIRAVLAVDGDTGSDESRSESESEKEGRAR